MTVRPQLSTTVPLQRLPHGFRLGEQQALGPTAPAPHIFPGPQVSGQITVCPQLFTFGPHATPAHVVVIGSGVQQLVPAQTCEAGHCAGHPISCPQLFVTLTPPQRPLHAAPLSEQQEPSDLQIAPAAAHAPLFPHATVCPQLLTAVPQLFPAHVVATGSGVHPHALAVHSTPTPLRPPQSTGRPQLSCV